MNTFLMVVLLLQSSLLLPPRNLAVNPAAVSQVPAKLQKDYDKLWSRFISGQADAQLTKDIDNFLKKQKNFEPKREKALLLATENLVRSAAQAEADNRFNDAEQLYRQALSIAPKDPTLHSRFADLLTKAGNPNEAEAELRIAEELMPPRTAIVRSETASKNDDLEDLGRWGNDIERFHQIQDAQAMTREQTAAIIVKYFPQILE